MTLFSLPTNSESLIPWRFDILINVLTNVSFTLLRPDPAWKPCSEPSGALPRGHASCYSARRAMLYTFIYTFSYLYVYLYVYFSGYETRGQLRGGPGGCPGGRWGSPEAGPWRSRLHKPDPAPCGLRRGGKHYACAEAPLPPSRSPAAANTLQKREGRRSRGGGGSQWAARGGAALGGALCPPGCRRRHVGVPAAPLPSGRGWESGGWESSAPRGLYPNERAKYFSAAVTGRARREHLFARTSRARRWRAGCVVPCRAGVSLGVPPARGAARVPAKCAPAARHRGRARALKGPPRNRSETAGGGTGAPQEVNFLLSRSTKTS